MTVEMDVLGFARHLAKTIIILDKQEHFLLEMAAKMVEKEAKSELGTYQQGAGPFEAWPTLSAATEDTKERLGYKLDAPLLRTEELRASIHHEVHGREAVVGSDDEAAIFMELGTHNIPARSFLGLAAYRKEEEIIAMISNGVVETICTPQRTDLKGTPGWRKMEGILKEGGSTVDARAALNEGMREALEKMGDMSDLNGLMAPPPSK